MGLGVISSRFSGLMRLWCGFGDPRAAVTCLAVAKSFGHSHSFQIASSSDRLESERVDFRSRRRERNRPAELPRGGRQFHAANPRQAADMRHGGIARRILRTRPSRATNATSIAKRMKKVWIAFQQTPATALRVERALQRVRDDPIVARVRQDE
jgi:hypothetical protein